jgi:hypothetical protein
LKSSKIIFWIVSLVVVGLIYFISKESFTQPGMERFDGKYKKISQYRNENNTGPIIRIIAVHALDTHEEWMRAFGDAQPHTKYGKTVVVFFSEEINSDLQLSPKVPYFNPDLENQVIASYEKTPMGDVKFRKWN